MTLSRPVPRPVLAVRAGRAVRKVPAVLAALAVSAVLLTGCGSPAAPGGQDAAPDGADTTGRPAAVVLPPDGALPDYQLGGAYEPDPRVGIVARDRSATPAAGRYSICYVNGFQTQPGERDGWDDDLVLRDAGGADVVDPDWPDEALIDTRDPAGRERIAARVGEWIRGCAEAGFDAVEFDNLDSYTRSGGVLTRADAVSLAARYVEAAHENGLAAAQKNAAQDAALLHDEAGFDFAVVEECAAYDECGAYSRVYGAHVVDIEYTDALPHPFAEVCADSDMPASTVLRDRDLTTPADADYVFALCP